MSNVISNAEQELQLSNGQTYILITTMAYSAQKLSSNTWEQDLVRWLVSRDQHVVGSGIVGFDVHEIFWSFEDFDLQKQFILDVFHHALYETDLYCILNFDEKRKRLLQQDLICVMGLFQGFTHEKIQPQKIWDFGWGVEDFEYRFCKTHHLLWSNYYTEPREAYRNCLVCECISSFS